MFVKKKYKDDFLLGERYERLKNKQEVKDLNHHLNMVLNELVRRLETAKAEDGLTEKEVRHLENLKKMKGKDLSSAEMLLERGLLLPEDIDKIKEELKEILEIESIEARERFILGKIQAIIENVGNLFNDVPKNVNIIFASLKRMDSLEQEYFNMQRKSKSLINDEELQERDRVAKTTDSEKLSERDELEAVHTEEEAKEEIDSSRSETEFIDDAEVALSDAEATDYYVSKGEDDAFNKGDAKPEQKKKKGLFSKLLKKR